jgi:hypothetical protein
MITKEQARAIAEEHLKPENNGDLSIDGPEAVTYYPNKLVSHGKRMGQSLDVYMVGYEEKWGYDKRRFGLFVDAHSGEVLYIITPHGYI